MSTNPLAMYQMLQANRNPQANQGLAGGIAPLLQALMLSKMRQKQQQMPGQIPQPGFQSNYNMDSANSPWNQSNLMPGQ